MFYIYLYIERDRREDGTCFVCARVYIYPDVDGKGERTSSSMPVGLCCTKYIIRLYVYMIRTSFMPQKAKACLSVLLFVLPENPRDQTAVACHAPNNTNPTGKNLLLLCVHPSGRPYPRGAAAFWSCDSRAPPR